MQNFVMKLSISCNIFLRWSRMRWILPSSVMIGKFDPYLSFVNKGKSEWSFTFLTRIELPPWIKIFTLLLEVISFFKTYAAEHGPNQYRSFVFANHELWNNSLTLFLSFIQGVVIKLLITSMDETGESLRHCSYHLLNITRNSDWRSCLSWLILDHGSIFKRSNTAIVLMSSKVLIE